MKNIFKIGPSIKSNMLIKAGFVCSMSATSIDLIKDGEIFRMNMAKNCLGVQRQLQSSSNTSSSLE